MNPLLNGWHKPEPPKEPKAREVIENLSPAKKAALAAYLRWLSEHGKQS